MEGKADAALSPSQTCPEERSDEGSFARRLAPRNDSVVSFQVIPPTWGAEMLKMRPAINGVLPCDRTYQKTYQVRPTSLARPFTHGVARQRSLAAREEDPLPAGCAGTPAGWRTAPHPAQGDEDQMRPRNCTILTVFGLLPVFDFRRGRTDGGKIRLGARALSADLPPRIFSCSDDHCLPLQEKLYASDRLSTAER